MTLTKADLTEKLLAETGLNKPEAKRLVDQFFEEIKATLTAGETVKLHRLGNFDLRDKRQRPGRNPKTGEEFPITARRVVTFKAGAILKGKVDAYADAKHGFE
jgi:integration host factor subunit alpha